MAKLDMDKLISEIKEREKVIDECWEDNVIPPKPRLEDLIKYKLRNGEVLVNFNGHFKQPETPVTLKESSMGHERSWEWIYDKLVGDWLWDEFDLSKYGPTTGDTPKRVEVIAKDFRIYNDWMMGVRTESKRFDFETCGECGEKVEFSFDGVEFQVRTLKSAGNTILAMKNGAPAFNRECDPVCTESGGQKDYTVEIDVPSGWLFFANDFRGLNPGCDKGRYINHNCEIKLEVQDYAEGNCFHVFVGNSCPGIFRQDNVITIGNTGYGDNDEPIQDFGKGFGSICTDLWWVSAMDSHYFWNKLRRNVARQRVNGKDTKGWQERGDQWPEVKMKVEPGRYQMTVSATPAVDGKDYSNGELFATIRRIGNVN